MRCLLFLSLVVLATGCAVIDKEHLARREEQLPLTRSLESPFLGVYEKSLFRATMEIREFRLTGYMLIKVSGDTSRRIFFANDIGMTIFDVEFVRDKFVTHYIFSPLHKKALFRIIEADLRALLLHQLREGQVPQYSDTKTGSLVLLQPADNRYYFLDSASLRINEIAGGTNQWDRYRIEMSYPDGQPFPVIRLSNPGIGLIINIKQIGE